MATPVQVDQDPLRRGQERETDQQIAFVSARRRQDQRPRHGGARFQVGGGAVPQPDPRLAHFRRSGQRVLVADRHHQVKVLNQPPMGC